MNLRRTAAKMLADRHISPATDPGYDLLDLTSRLLSENPRATVGVVLDHTGPEVWDRLLTGKVTIGETLDYLRDNGTITQGRWSSVRPNLPYTGGVPVAGLFVGKEDEMPSAALVIADARAVAINPDARYDGVRTAFVHSEDQGRLIDLLEAQMVADAEVVIVRGIAPETLAVPAVERAARALSRTRAVVVITDVHPNDLLPMEV